MPQAPASTASLPEVSPLDPAAVQRLLDLDPTGANQLLARVGRAFESSIGRLIPQLDAALAAQDWESVRSVAHTLKSSMASIGALKLSVLCADIERMIRDGQTQGLARLVDGLHADIGAVSDSLRALIDSRA
jgi:HPt (histidine-containing phosphotransfer) domain-containing protein